MPDPLGELLARAEWPDPALTAGELAGWPPGERERLERLGLLAEDAPAESVACDSCGRDHVGRVVWSDVPGRPRRAFLPCPEAGRVPIHPDRLRRWAVRLPALARLAAAGLGASGRVVERVPGRLWRLGIVGLGGRTRTAFLGVGLTRLDTPSLVRVPELASADVLLFTPCLAPPAGVWELGRGPSVVPLAGLVSLSDAGLALDQSPLEPAAPTAGAVQIGPAPTWEEVALTVEDRHVRVRVGESERRVGFAEAGFADRRRKGAPNEVWTLLTLLARRSGVLDSGDAVRTKTAALKRSVSRLRKALRPLAGIDGDPFHPVGRGGSYRARFRVRAAAGAVFRTPAGATWDRVALTELEPGVVAVAVEADAVNVAYPSGAAGERWEAVTEAGERTARYPVADLGLTAPARDALLAVLRGGGTVRRKEHDPGMLSLGEGLTHFLQINGPPFEYRGGVWTARFEARSLVRPSDR